MCACVRDGWGAPLPFPTPLAQIIIGLVLGVLVKLSGQKQIIAAAKFDAQCVPFPPPPCALPLWRSPWLAHCRRARVAGCLLVFATTVASVDPARPVRAGVCAVLRGVVCPARSLFSLGLLPIIIFESGYSLNLKAFFSQVGAFPPSVD